MTASDSSEESAKLVWKSIEGTAFTFADGTSEPPPLLPPVTVQLNRMGTGVLFVGLLCASFVLVLSILMGLWTFVRRETRVVRSAQPEFLILLCSGTFIMGCSIIPMSLQEPVRETLLNLACMADIWLFMLGFAISFSALLAKMQRINKIFLVGRFRRVVVQPRDVMLPFFCLVMANLIILSSWTIVAPLKYRRVAWAFDQYGRPVESFGVCRADHGKKSLPFLIPLVVLNLGCVFFANVHAYRARKIRTEFSESKYIAMSMASIFQAFILGIPVFVAVLETPNPSGFFLLKASLVSLVCLAVLLPMFTPKIWAHRSLLSSPPARHKPPSGIEVYARPKNENQVEGMAVLSRENNIDAAPTKSFVFKGRWARFRMGHGSVTRLFPTRAVTTSTLALSRTFVGSVTGSLESLRSTRSPPSASSLRHGHDESEELQS